MSEPAKKPGRIPESYSPKDKPEIMKAVGVQNKPIAYETHVVKGKLDRFETDRLIIRHWRPEDWRDMRELGLSNNTSENADCDHLWPADDKSYRKLCAGKPGKVPGAVEVKRLAKVVCTIGLNGMDKDGRMDIGHVMNSTYLGHDYEYEALAVLYDYCFRHYPAKAIIAMWVMSDREKLAPLEKLGMELVSTGMGKAWRANSEGVIRDVEGCTPIITRESWERANPTSYNPKDKPESINYKFRFSGFRGLDFTNCFSSLYEVFRDRSHLTPEEVARWPSNRVWEELADPRIVPACRRIGTACDRSHTLHWQMHSLCRSRDWRKRYVNMDWGMCETAVMILQKIKEYDDVMYGAVCEMIKVLEGDIT
jgi:RimJ/RimL family protein N-acetyltransferase